MTIGGQAVAATETFDVINPATGGLAGKYPAGTLLADATDGMRIVEEEQFGPVLPIIRYSDVEEALDSANRSSMGLGGSVWSKDADAAARLALRLESGSAWINGHGGLNPNAPFGGVKQSGIGTEFGVEGLKEFTTIQTLHRLR